MDYKKIANEKFSFIYITTKDCKVCKILQPKLRTLAGRFQNSTFHLIELDDHSDAAGFFMALSVPTFLVFSEGKELIRTARHIDLAEVQQKLEKYYNLLFA